MALAIGLRVPWYGFATELRIGLDVRKREGTLPIELAITTTVNDGYGKSVMKIKTSRGVAFQAERTSVHLPYVHLVNELVMLVDAVTGHGEVKHHQLAQKLSRHFQAHIGMLSTKLTPQDDKAWLPDTTELPKVKTPKRHVLECDNARR